MKKYTAKPTYSAHLAGVYGKGEGTIVGINGNAFALMAHTQRLLKKAGWINEEIETVMEEAKSSDYQHLLRVLSATLTMEEGEIR